MLDSARSVLRRSSPKRPPSQTRIGASSRPSPSPTVPTTDSSTHCAASSGATKSPSPSGSAQRAASRPTTWSGHAVALASTVNNPMPV